MIEIDKLIGTGVLTNGQTYKQILLLAHYQIGNYDRWTQGAFAKDAMGHIVKPRNPGACQWCLLGSVAYCSNPYGLTPPPLLQYLDAMVQHIYGKGADGEDRFKNVGEMNDYLTHEDVLLFLKRCIDHIPD